MKTTDKTKKMAVAALAGLFTLGSLGACAMTSDSNGAKCSASGCNQKKEANSCSAGNTCSNKAGEKNSCKGEKNSCKGEKNSCKH